MHDSWGPLFERETSKDYFVALRTFLEHERRVHEVYPDANDVFAAFALTPLDAVKVVILGQDPYHGPGQAHGLSFSVRRGAAIPPSLRNIFTELSDDLPLPVPSHGDLTAWAQRGVLLLNTTLTVRRGEPLSHRDAGWQHFTNAAIAEVNSTADPCVFLLWGAHAHRARRLIDESIHRIVETAHPSPLSARRGFFGSRPFSTADDWLQASGRTPVDWRLE